MKRLRLDGPLKFLSARNDLGKYVIVLVQLEEVNDLIGWSADLEDHALETLRADAFAFWISTGCHCWRRMVTVADYLIEERRKSRQAESLNVSFSARIAE